MPSVPGRRFSPRAPGRVAAAGLAAALAVLALVSAGAATGMAAVAVTPVRKAAPSATPTAIRSPTTPARISLFGDSLAFEAKTAFAARLARRGQERSALATYPTTALCDFRDAINQDLFVHRPDVLVLEFSGNSGTACMRDGLGALPEIGSPRWRSRYIGDLRAVLAVARGTGTTVVWATAPPVSPAKFPSNYPRTLAAAVRKLAVRNDGLRVVDSGVAIASDDDSFARTLPCAADEQAYCRNGRLVVRSDDGLHFDCHGSPGAFGQCGGYSAGGRRFGEAMADAAVDAADFGSF